MLKRGELWKQPIKSTKGILWEKIFTTESSSAILREAKESKGIIRVEKPFSWLNALIFNELSSQKRLVMAKSNQINFESSFTIFWWGFVCDEMPDDCKHSMSRLRVQSETLHLSFQEDSFHSPFDIRKSNFLSWLMVWLGKWTEVWCGGVFCQSSFIIEAQRKTNWSFSRPTSEVTCQFDSKESLAKSIYHSLDLNWIFSRRVRNRKGAKNFFICEISKEAVKSKDLNLNKWMSSRTSRESVNTEKNEGFRCPGALF